MKETIVIGMPLKNDSGNVQKAIKSVLSQKGVKRRLLLLISIDNANKETEEVVNSFLPHKRILITHGKFGSAHQNRNFIHHYIRDNIPEAILIGRLDGDDYLYNDLVVMQIEKIWEQTDFDVMLMGNKQCKSGEVLPWINKADHRLLDVSYLEERLQKMALGVAQAELPSCNTFIRPSININYPAVPSGEDHWFTVELLLQKSQLRIHIAEELIYCVYSLDGQLTNENKKRDAYLENRRRLLNFFRTKIR